MKKIAIITIESPNYGNRLQNYALQQVILSLGFHVETLRRSNLPLYRKILKKMKNIIQVILQTKGAKFRKFDKLIYKSQFYATNNKISDDLSNYYDYFVVGSDQVWNPYFDFVGKVELLSFARSEQKIAYAASFGVSKLPEHKINVYQEYLKDFKNISVREEAGAVIIKKLLQNDVSIVLDPTLMLTSDEWRSIEKKPPKMVNEDYVLVYALGEKNMEFTKAIEEMSIKYEIVDVNSSKENGREWAIGPAEFLYLIDHANFVLTDSFHGSVFSIIFHTKFKVFKRTGLEMNSRIETLLKITGLDKDKLDFEGAEMKLHHWRKESLSFLINSLYSE